MMRGKTKIKFTCINKFSVQNPREV